MASVRVLEQYYSTTYKSCCIRAELKRLPAAASKMSTCHVSVNNCQGMQCRLNLFGLDGSTCLRRCIENALGSILVHVCDCLGTRFSFKTHPTVLLHVQCCRRSSGCCRCSNKSRRRVFFFLPSFLWISMDETQSCACVMHFGVLLAIWLKQSIRIVTLQS